MPSRLRLAVQDGAVFAGADSKISKWSIEAGVCEGSMQLEMLGSVNDCQAPDSMSPATSRPAFLKRVLPRCCHASSVKGNLRVDTRCCLASFSVVGVLWGCLIHRAACWKACKFMSETFGHVLLQDLESGLPRGLARLCSGTIVHVSRNAEWKPPVFQDKMLASGDSMGLVQIWDTVGI